MNRISRRIKDHRVCCLVLVISAITGLTPAFADHVFTGQPEQISLEKADKSNPEGDCLAAVKRGDWRFLMTSRDRSGYLGVPRYAEHWVREKGVKIIKDASDFFGMEEAARLDSEAEDYAYKYNRFLLKQVPNSDQPEPGYGIPGPDDVVRKGTELTTANIAQGRDLGLYDDGGNLDCRQWVFPEKPKHSCIPKVRAFIWRHWQRKQRGYIRVTTNSPDWTGTTHIFIEPDADGIWHVLQRVADNRIRDLIPIVSVARVKHTKVDMPGGPYVLSFRGSDGTEIGRL